MSALGVVNPSRGNRRLLAHGTPARYPRLSRLAGLGQESTALVNAIAAGITRQENVPASYNNPGAIINPSTGQLQTYPTLAAGEAALDAQINLNISRGLTLEQFFAGDPGVYAGYSPAAAGNDPTTYAENVSTWEGIPLDTPLTQVAQTYTGTSLDTTDLTGTDTSADTTDTTDTGDNTGDDGSDNTLLYVGIAVVAIGAAVVFGGHA